MKNLFSAFISTVLAKKRCESRKYSQQEYILSQQTSTTSNTLAYIFDYAKKLTLYPCMSLNSSFLYVI